VNVLSLTTAGIDLSSTAKAQPIPVPGDAVADAGDVQVAAVHVAVTGDPSTTMTLAFILWDKVAGVARGIIEAVCTKATGGSRASQAGTGGKYLMTVAFPNGSNVLELLGGDAVRQWYVCAPAFATGVTAVDVSVSFSTQV
jgi:hypothetical protein